MKSFIKLVNMTMVLEWHWFLNTRQSIYMDQLIWFFTIAGCIRQFKITLVLSEEGKTRALVSFVLEDQKEIATDWIIV